MSAQAGDVGFVHQTDWIDRIIQWAQARKYGKRSEAARFNHCFLMVSDLSLIEAQSGGVVQRDLTEYIGMDVEFWRPLYAPGNDVVAVSAMRELMGQRYGFLTILCEALCFLTGTKLRFGLQGTEICSGAVSYALTRANVDVGVDEAFNSPADLASAAFVQGWTRVTA